MQENAKKGVKVKPWQISNYLQILHQIFSETGYTIVPFPG